MVKLQVYCCLKRENHLNQASFRSFRGVAVGGLYFCVGGPFAAVLRPARQLAGR
ncbi:hypothetical protein GGR51DRAFT_563120 [Nemania sp. FL0031]|nr:hypothetical protein GGR51DRAFT_563120 [Nemania sp. FL0031]